MFSRSLQWIIRVLLLVRVRVHKHNSTRQLHTIFMSSFRLHSEWQACYWARILDACDADASHMHIVSFDIYKFYKNGNLLTCNCRWWRPTRPYTSWANTCPTVKCSVRSIRFDLICLSCSSRLLTRVVPLDLPARTDLCLMPYSSLIFGRLWLSARSLLTWASWTLERL